MNKEKYDVVVKLKSHILNSILTFAHEDDENDCGIGVLFVALFYIFKNFLDEEDQDKKYRTEIKELIIKHANELSDLRKKIYNN